LKVISAVLDNSRRHYVSVVGHLVISL